MTALLWSVALAAEPDQGQQEEWLSPECATYKKFGNVVAWGSAGVLVTAGALSYAGGVLDNRELVWAPMLAYPVGIAGSVIGGGMLIASSKECGMGTSAFVAGAGSVLLGGGVVLTSWGAVIMEATHNGPGYYSDFGHDVGVVVLALGLASFGTGLGMMAAHQPKALRVSALPRFGRDAGITLVGRF